ncbi:uncharacterized protein LOC126660206 [Mercurialis annua]|uniref:uncharacterized protein LOC126660206 n=1 Tax=Mercurialis annua TaxID=3986 RepID=UPI00216030E1|nr:uncharacterized protein LOC126660206 [Mercurialis annua]
MMDLETENRIATILLREAAELRRQAEKEGVHVYLQKPTVRGRPNSRFLTATVRGVQQANRAVEVDEMWRARQKELELDDRQKGPRHENTHLPRSTSKRHAENGCSSSISCSSSVKASGNLYSRDDEGLKDDEVENFLHSRVKRGRGAVGSRMDETGPYLPSSLESMEKRSTLDLRKHHVILGPDKLSSSNFYGSSEEELDNDRRKKAKKVRSGSSDKHSKKHKTKERSRDKKKNRKEKRSKH